jgi:capsular exopolysaccharide synthesis family protein
MSRIYDALQRADVERRAAQAADVTAAAEPFGGLGAEELSQVAQGIVLEDIPLHSWNPSMDFFPTIGDRGEIMEQFRGLRSQIYQFRDQAPLKTILVSSGMPAEGKTFVAANLAMSLARNENNRILLIDADLRGPSLHTVLGASSTPGLAEYLEGEAGLNDIVQRSQNPCMVEPGIVRTIPNLVFIPAGACGDDSSELVASHRIEELIQSLAPLFDWIVIDSSPALMFADAVDLARAADAVLLVARGAVTPFSVAQRVQTAFSNSRILGFVLNAVSDAPNTSNYYYYGKQESGGGSYRRKDKRQ